jgi:16S rRNA (guanine527-N7)-methyltransferase
VTDPRLRDRILERAGLASIELTVTEAQQLAEYYALLQHWNQTINLSSMVFEGIPDATLDRIIVEPLVIKGLIGECAGDWLDIGSGGGSPAVPLKIVCPDKELTMVESKSRKAAFLREVVRKLRLERSSVWEGRAEELAQSAIGGAELVTIRALKLSLPLLTALTALLRPGGRLAVFGSGAPPSIGDFPFKLIDSTKLPKIARLKRSQQLDDNAVHWFARDGL